jgi:MFS family permease
MAEVTQGNEYCIYDSQALAAFTSSLYVAGLVASLVASRVSKALGRQAIMLMGGALFFAGAALTGGAVNLAMLIVGRMLLGFGVGFTCQVNHHSFCSCTGDGFTCTQK